MPRFRRLREEEIGAYLNFGSDEDSGESDEEELAASFISRVFQSMMETSLDNEEVTANNPGPAADADAALGGFIPADACVTATEQPWALHHFDWRAFPNPQIQPELRRETFSQIIVGPTTPSVDPYDIFIDIWDGQIMENIASETNRYAQELTSQMIQAETLCHQSRITRWCDTSVDELYVYFGVVLAMSIYRLWVLAMGGLVKSRLEEYWGATPNIFCTPGFSVHMSIDRFLLLNRCLHFCNNASEKSSSLRYNYQKP